MAFLPVLLRQAVWSAAHLIHSGHPPPNCIAAAIEAQRVPNIGVGGGDSVVPKEAPRDMVVAFLILSRE